MVVGRIWQFYFGGSFYDGIWIKLRVCRTDSVINSYHKTLAAISGYVCHLLLREVRQTNVLGDKGKSVNNHT